MVQATEKLTFRDVFRKVERILKHTGFKPILLRAFMIAVTISKGLLWADGHHSRSANHKGEGDGNKREDSFHRHVLSKIGSVEIAQRPRGWGRLRDRGCAPCWGRERPFIYMFREISR
jgi:hypothetical protein